MRSFSNFPKDAGDAVTGGMCEKSAFPLMRRGKRATGACRNAIVVFLFGAVVAACFAPTDTAAKIIFVYL